MFGFIDKCAGETSLYGDRNGGSGCGAADLDAFDAEERRKLIENDQVTSSGRHPSVRYQLRPIRSTGTEPLLPMIFSSGTVSSYRFWMPALVVRVINT
jgi:hypothetical protein